MKILVVDICQGMIERLKDILSESGKKITIYDAVSYENALTIFNEKKPEVMLLDTSLPCNKSFTLLKDIRQTDHSISVITLSFNIDDHIKQKCRLFSVDFFLDKYYEFEKIPSIVQTIYMKKKKMALA